tara:strand:- start:10035 stop:10280 length:246 start_codon:yes stop_codon:yes gene_type:complete
MPIAKAFGPKPQKQADLTLEIDGVKTTFTLPEAIDTTTLQVYNNGLKQRYGDTITSISVSSFTLSYAPTVGETLTIIYVPL